VTQQKLNRITKAKFQIKKQMSYNQVKRKEEKQFRENMIFLMEEKKLSTRQMAGSLDHVKLNTFKAWYYGSSNPPLAYARKIAEIFGHTLEEMTTEPLIKRIRV
jgi:DNA-binding XRE family transcriptional regulator